MKKISKIVLVLAALCMVFSAFAVVASAENTASMAADAYFGEYTTANHSGAANIFFGTVNTDATEYGVIITPEGAANSLIFPGLVKGEDGKFGVAIYDMPEGLYSVAIYSGDIANAGAQSEYAVSAGKNFYANKGLQVKVTLDWNGARNHEQWYIYAAAGDKITAPDATVEGIVLPGELDGWYKADDTEFDFENDVVTEDITLKAQWIADDISEKVYDAYTTASGKMSFGTSVPADISDGSTLNIEFDVIAANMPKANYNFYVMLGYDNNHYNQSGRFFTFQYANWAYFDPWPGHYLTQNNKNNVGVDNGTGWDPTQMIVKDQSVKFSYTAPTAETTGSLYVYVKHMAQSDSEYVLLADTTNLTLDNVQDTSRVFMGLCLDENAGARGWTFTGYRSWVDRVGGGVEENYGFNSATNGDADVVENTEIEVPTFVTWEEGKLLNIRANTDASVDSNGSFQMWYGNMQGVDLAPGETLTWEFTVDSVEYGLWYNVWGGVSVVSGVFPTSVPQSYGKTVGFYGNFALDTGSYDGRYATICGDTNYNEYCELEEGYSNFDPYTDGCNYGGEALNIKIEYTAPDFDNMIDGSLVYYKKVASSEDWIKVTSVLYPDLTDDLHIVIWYNSGQNAGGAWDFIMSDYKMYTSEGQDLNRVISVGGIGQVQEYVPAE
ncbi:MAG: hypothetical protein IJF76_04015 [Clostridia bacterium]|nr:hypothetical protein [Clostridia bacterium]